VAAIKRVDGLPGAEADAEVPLGKVYLDVAVGQKGHLAGVALLHDPGLAQRGFRPQVEDGAIELVHRWDVLRAQVHVVELDRHVPPPLRPRGPRTTVTLELAVCAGSSSVRRVGLEMERKARGGLITGYQV
jgi:hypothetical protein